MSEEYRRSKSVMDLGVFILLTSFSYSFITGDEDDNNSIISSKKLVQSVIEVPQEESSNNSSRNRKSPALIVEFTGTEGRRWSSPEQSILELTAVGTAALRLCFFLSL